MPCVSVYVRERATPTLCTGMNETQNHMPVPKPYQVLVSLYSNGNTGDSYLCRRCNLNEITYKNSIAPSRCVLSPTPLRPNSLFRIKSQQLVTLLSLSISIYALFERGKKDLFKWISVFPACIHVYYKVPLEVRRGSKIP